MDLKEATRRLKAIEAACEKKLNDSGPHSWSGPKGKMLQALDELLHDIAMEARWGKAHARPLPEEPETKPAPSERVRGCVSVGEDAVEVDLAPETWSLLRHIADKPALPDQGEAVKDKSYDRAANGYCPCFNDHDGSCMYGEGLERCLSGKPGWAERHCPAMNSNKLEAKPAPTASVIKCPVCCGDGEDDEDSSRPCYNCNGDGVVREPFAEEVPPVSDEELGREVGQILVNQRKISLVLSPAEWAELGVAVRAKREAANRVT